jgi:uncharacterized circularly permuted ATP-grasp superfamily protein/uncharacterized alpha-E superfamily protein
MTEPLSVPLQASSLIAGYHPLPGVPDEMMDTLGALRPGWAPLVEHLSARGPEALAEDFGRGAQHLADAGVFFRNHGDASLAARDWPFSPVPIVLPEVEWRGLCDGLIQRADLLEAVVADLYGDNRLIAEGHLPAALIAQNPEWLRPMVGVRPKSGNYLHFLAFEVGRGPDGRWWVLSDRTEGPSGAGFALENRVAATRVFPELFRHMPIRRLAGFFQCFRDALDGLRSDPNSRVGIFTSGPLTDTYFEQAYIARYLGLLLLEGEDLIVDQGQLKMRTIRGLEPVDVLWRRLDGLWADPLELREDSQLGTPGLMTMVRQGKVTMANALGAGVLETQALMAFLPKISRLLMGGPLKLPNVATWWCGQAAERAHVAAHSQKMMIGPALATRMPYETGAVHAIGGKMKGEAKGSLRDWLSANAGGLMGKELVTLSTTPVYSNGALVPRPMTIRLFLARTPTGWLVMPGGFARIGANADASAIAMRKGGMVADVWVVGKEPDTGLSLLHRAQGPETRPPPEPLPARAADNLYWLGRYVERSEGLVRVVRAYQARLESSGSVSLLAVMQAQLEAHGIRVQEPLPKGLRATLASAVHCANQIRDRFSVDGYAALKDLEKSMQRISRTAQPGNDSALVMGVLLRKIAGFSGLVHDNMYRAAGWQFLTIGRALERAAMTLECLIAMADPQAPEGSLEAAIEIGDSAMIHRRRHALLSTRETVIDLLVLDQGNPRAVQFQLDLIQRRVAALTEMRVPGQMTEVGREALGLQTALRLHTPTSLDRAALEDLRRQVFSFADALNRTFIP